MSKATTKLLSICLFGRNDDYMPDFLYRLSMTINFIAHSCERIGRLGDIEIVVTDWNSHVPLVDAVELTEAGAGITRFVYVEPTEQENKPIPLCLAMNTALRNASGMYLAMCGADAIIPSPSFAALFDVIEGCSLYTTAENKSFICGRYSIPYPFIRSQPSIEEWERYLRIHSWHIEQDRAMGGFLSGGAGFLMFHRDLVSASGGLNERLDSYGWGWSDVDLTLRMMGLYASYDLRSAGVMIYDMQHEPAKGGRPQAIKNQAPHYIPRSFDVNGESWGQPQEQVRCMPAYTRPPKYGKAEENTGLIVDLNNVATRNQIVGFLDAVKVGRTSAQETLVLLILSAYAKQRTLFRYFESGISKGLSARFVACLFKWSELYGCDRWREIDDNNGPHIIARYLYEEPIRHRGALRLINKGLDESVNVLARSYDGEFKFDVALVREQGADTPSAIESLLTALDEGSALLYVGETDEGLQRVKDSVDSLGAFAYLESHEHVVMIIARNISGSLDVSAEVLMQLQQVRNPSYQSVTNFYRSLCEIPQGKPLVLYGFGTVARLALPHIRDRVIAIIDETLSADLVEIMEDIKVIKPENLHDYKDAVVVVTPVIYREQILKGLEPYENQVFCLYM